MSPRNIRLVALFGALAVSIQAFATTPPTIYSSPAHQSPVRAEPDDLLMLPGADFAAGDVVVYQAIGNTTQPLVTPTSVPTSSTDVEGVAPVVSFANVPNSLTVRLPTV